jgi:hypothetical protein
MPGIDSSDREFDDKPVTLLLDGLNVDLFNGEMNLIPLDLHLIDDPDPADDFKYSPQNGIQCLIDSSDRIEGKTQDDLVSVMPFESDFELGFQYVLDDPDFELDLGAAGMQVPDSAWSMGFQEPNYLLGCNLHSGHKDTPLF